MPTVSRGTSSPLFSGVSMLEDFADRINHVWTFWLLLILASIISWKQQSFNHPILCNTPAHFTTAQVAYSHGACWASYQHLEMSTTELPSYEIKDSEPVVWIYKWLSLILCIQALLFKCPNVVMHVLHGYSGVNFEKLAGLTTGYQNLNLMERSYLGKQTGRYVYNWCKQFGHCFPTRFLSFVWFLVKVLFCANVIAQFVLVDKLVSTRNPPEDISTSYGDVIYANLFNDNITEWTESPIFPRRIMCHYRLRQIHNIQEYQLQCDFPINEFNEYIYMGLWMWLLVVAVISCLSLVIWLVRTLVPIGRERYISRMLELSEDLNSTQLMRKDIAELADVVGEDGVMVLKLIASNSLELLVRDAVSTMFHMQHTHRQSHPMNVPEVTNYPTASAPAQTSTQGGLKATAHAPEKA